MKQLNAEHGKKDQRVSLTTTVQVTVAELIAGLQKIKL